MSYPNLFKSANMPRTWIGHGGTRVWRVRKERYGFRAIAMNGDQFHKQTLIGISNELERRAKLIQAAKGLP